MCEILPSNINTRPSAKNALISFCEVREIKYTTIKKVQYHLFLAENL